MADLVWEAFQRTRVRIDLGHAFVDLAPIPGVEPGAFLPDAMGPIHILTAWNPQGHQAPLQANRAAQQRLAIRIESYEGVTTWPATGYGGGLFDDDGTWREDGVAIQGLTRPSALALAVEFDQRAIFEWRNEPGGFRLIECDGSLDESRGWKSTIHSKR